MRTATLFGAVVMLSTGIALGSQPTRPEVVFDRGQQQVLLRSLPQLLEEPEIQERLTSGLTNTFAVDATARGDNQRLRGRAQVDVRWEMWDEVFIVDVVAWDGTVHRTTLAGSEALQTWWESTEIAILAAEGLVADSRVEVTVSFLPFSASEERSAEEWLVASTRRSGARDGGGGTVVRAMVASSIVREPLLHFTWELEVVVVGDK
jgi:hypothetical protein